MSKVKANLLKVNLKKGNFKLAVYIALQVNAENGSVVTSYAYDDVKEYLSAQQFAGYLSALKEEGKYKPSSEGFGRVY